VSLLAPIFGISGGAQRRPECGKCQPPAAHQIEYDLSGKALAGAKQIMRKSIESQCKPLLNTKSLRTSWTKQIDREK